METTASAGQRLHHVALGSRNVEHMALFYARVFGLPELARHRDADGAVRSIWLDLGGTLLMIERTDQPPHCVQGIGAGPFLLAFRVSPSERWQLERALEQEGLAIEGRTGCTSYARDPDGNRIAISHHPEPDVPR